MPTPPFVQASPPLSATRSVSVRRLEAGQVLLAPDVLAVEEPLEIRLTHGPERQTERVAITMRTPGHDPELALGFLYTEGLIHHQSDVLSVTSDGPEGCAQEKQNVLTVALRSEVVCTLDRLERHTFTNSSCGVCGKTSIAALAVQNPPEVPKGTPCVPAAVIHTLPGQLRAGQQVFACTGGLHAAALFTPAGELVAMREDVGRHNATDKLIGACLLAGRLPCGEGLILFSGRVSFELVQKALMAGIPVLAAIGAPSSLAVEVAQRYGLTLIGFLRDGRFNVYAGGERLAETADLITAYPTPTS